MVVSCGFGTRCCDEMALPLLLFSLCSFWVVKKTSYPIAAIHMHLPPSWYFAVAPRMALYCDDHGNPVCEAETEKSAAEISWVPESNSTPRADSHGNGTVTVVSRFAARSTNGKNPTCIVSHATLNETKSINCSSCKLPFLCSVFKVPFSPLFTFLLHSYRNLQ